MKFSKSQGKETMPPKNNRSLPIAASAYAEIIDKSAVPVIPGQVLVNGEPASEASIGITWSEVDVERLPALYAEMVIAADLRGDLDPDERDARLMMMSGVAVLNDPEAINLVFTELVERLTPKQNLQ